uniref:Uncharacterized protein n=1 Tax=Octopus bimaculoides TaxID=37653 RepID=A0A0L8HFB0_OCTBM
MCGFHTCRSNTYLKALCPQQQQNGTGGMTALLPPPQENQKLQPQLLQQHLQQQNATTAITTTTVGVKTSKVQSSLQTDDTDTPCTLDTDNSEALSCDEEVLNPQEGLVLGKSGKIV